MTALIPYLADISKGILSLPIKISTRINMEKIVENDRRWLEAFPASLYTFLPMYWLTTTAPPDANAVK